MKKDKPIEELATKILFDHRIDKNASPEMKSFLEYVVYGRTYYHVEGEMVDKVEDGKLPDYSITQYKMSPKEIIEKFKHLLSEDEIKHLEEQINYHNGTKRNFTKD